MNPAETKDRKEIIREGLDRFLDENELDLSKQKTGQIIDRLFFFYADTESISVSGVHNYLQEHFDYNEYNRALQDHAQTPEGAEMALTSLLLATDHKKENSMKSLFTVCLVVFLSLGFLTYLSYASSPKSENAMSVIQANNLKDLVKNITDAERINGNKTSHASVWNAVKRSETVSRYGYKNSYKDFSAEQYRAAKIYLENWLEKAQASRDYVHRGKVIHIAGTDITVDDGDTFKAGGEIYRLWGVDAFELNQECYKDGEAPYPCGQHSKEALENILSNGRDITCEKTTTDRYQRVVVKCDVDGTELGALMAESGWAIDYSKYSGDHFKDVQKRAQKTRTGAWAGCFVKPWDFRYKENLNVCD